jgi:hypothetical protein
MTSTVTDRIYGESASVAVKAPCLSVSVGAPLPLLGLGAVGSYSPNEGDRILVKDQTDPSTNGIYNASAGAWARSGDFNGPYDAVQGTLIVVFYPNAQATIYQLTTFAPIIGTTPLNFASFVNPNQTFPQTKPEALASVVPTNTAWPPYNVMRYANAVGDGVANDQPAVQAAFTASGVAGATVVFPPGFTFRHTSDVTVPVASSVGAPIPCAQGPGWGTVSVIFDSGCTFGFTILGTGATTGDVTGSTYNYAGTFRDLGVQLNGTANSAFYTNSVNQPRLENVWVRGSGTNGRGVYFLNCLVPVFKDCLVTGCGSATQYSVEFDGCTTSSWRGSRISGGNTTLGGLAIDRCTNFVGESMSIESCGTPIDVSGKPEAVLANTGIILRGLELENPGSLGQYIRVGAGCTGSALVVDMLVDGMYGSPSGTTTVAYGIKLTNITGFEARGCHFTQGSAPISCFEIANTNVSGVVIRPHRNLQSLGIPWVRYNGTQVKHAGPQMEWQLGVTNGGVPVCTSRGLDEMQASAQTGATPSPSLGAMGGFMRSFQLSQGGATNVTSMAIQEAGAEVYIYHADGNSTYVFGSGAGQFITKSGANLGPVATGTFVGWKSNGTAWSQIA